MFDFVKKSKSLKKKFDRYVFFEKKKSTENVEKAIGIHESQDKANSFGKQCIETCTCTYIDTFFSIIVIVKYKEAATSTGQNCAPR
jgi:hypothetical protein